MKLGFKKIAAALTAAAVAVSMCGCMDNGKIMTVDGMEINNGVYLYYQQTAYSDAQSQIKAAQQEELDKIADNIVNDTSSESSSSSSESSSSSSSSSSSFNYFSTSVAGKSTSQWVKDETLRLVKQFVGVQRLCEQKGISLEQSEKDEISEQVKGVWENSNTYIQYFFGFDTAGKYYESNGIGRDSYQQITTAGTLKTKLFSKLYDKDGETPVADEELNLFLKDNYACAFILELPYEDAEGNALTSDSDKKAVEDYAEQLTKRISNGDSLIDVKYDFDLKEEQDSSKIQIEEYYDKNPVEGKTKEEYVAEELAKLTVDKAESEEEFLKYYQKGSNSLDEAVSEFLFNAKDDGKAATFKTDEKVYVIARLDVTTRTDWIEGSRTSLLMNFKGDDFEDYLDNFSASLPVNANSYLVDSKYKPERLANTSAAV